MCPNLGKTADLVTYTEDILYGKVRLLSSGYITDIMKWNIFLVAVSQLNCFTFFQLMHHPSLGFLGKK